MFHVEVAPLGGILGPLKSDLGVFWLFQGTDFMMGKNKNANFSKSPHGPIFKFLWWFVKWFHENGTNPSTGELFDPYKPLYKPFQQKNKWPDGLFYIGPSVVARLTMTTFFGNSARINKA